MVSAVVVVRILKIFVVLFVVLGIVILVVSVFVLAVVMRFSMMLSSTTVVLLAPVDVTKKSEKKQKIDRLIFMKGRKKVFITRRYTIIIILFSLSRRLRLVSVHV